MNLIFSSTAAKIRGANDSETFTATYSPKLSYFGNTIPVPTIIQDANILVTSGIIVHTDATISIIPGSSDFTNKVTRNYVLTNLTLTIASLNGYTLTNLAGGTSNILITDGISSKILACTTTNITTGSSNVLIDFVTASLARKLTTSINNLVVNKVAGSLSQDVTIDQNGTGYNTFVRNTNAFFDGLDLTAVSLATDSLATAYNLLSVDGWAATIISPRHVVSANHAHTGNAVFKGNDGTLFDCTISNWMQIGSSDIAIGYISNILVNGVSIGGVLPVTVTPAKVFPSIWRIKLPNKKVTGIPVFYAGHGMRIAIGQWVEGSIIYYSSLDNIEIHISDNPTLAAFYNTGIAPTNYSSGFPIFSVIDAQPILMGCFHAAAQQTFGIAPMLSDHIAEINAAMATLHGSSTYELQTVDISSYPSY